MTVHVRLQAGGTVPGKPPYDAELDAARAAAPAARVTPGSGRVN